MAPDSRLIFCFNGFGDFSSVQSYPRLKSAKTEVETFQLTRNDSTSSEDETLPLEQSKFSSSSTPLLCKNVVSQNSCNSPSFPSTSNVKLISQNSNSSPIDFTQHQTLPTNVSQSKHPLELCRVKEQPECLQCSPPFCKNSNRPKVHGNRIYLLLYMIYLLIRFTIFSISESIFYINLKISTNSLINIKILPTTLHSKKSSYVNEENHMHNRRRMSNHIVRQVKANDCQSSTLQYSNLSSTRVATIWPQTNNGSPELSSSALPTLSTNVNSCKHAHDTTTSHHHRPSPVSSPASSSSSTTTTIVASHSSLSYFTCLSSSLFFRLLTLPLSSSRKLIWSSCRWKGWSSSVALCLRRWTPKWLLATPSLWQFVVLLLACLPKDVIGSPNERRLLADLLGNYNPLERPVANETDPVEVSFGITLQQIIDVDEKNQLLITNTWLKLEWKDVNLQWNETDYGKVKDLRIPPYKIWKPDVLMYNSADEGFDGTFQTKVVVSSDGNCLYIPPGIFKSTCKIDITWFPFDDQKCKMKFGSWTYSGWQLNLLLQNEEGGDLSDFIKNGEWDLIGCPGKRNAIYYQCCPEPYVDVTFEIMIRRRTLYYFCNLILPCVLIASMAVLGFTLPPDCGEKLSLEITILLSLTLFLNMVSATTPATSESVPLIGTYFNCIMFMVASSVVSTVLILNYHHRSADTHEMSPMVRSMFLQWLPWVLRMHRPGEKITRKTIMMSNKMKELELKERSSKSLLANVLDIDDDFRAHTLPHPGHNTNNSTIPGGIIRIPHSGHSVDDSHLVHTCMSQCTRELNLILKEIRVITDKMRKDDEEFEVTNDWRFAAMVVDRMCLIVFTLFTVTATVAVLLSAPHIMVP